jgi:hypothetical protein
MNCRFFLAIAIVMIMVLIRTYSQAAFTLNGEQISQQIGQRWSAMHDRHYQAEWRFKEMGGDTFEIRNFIISHRANLNNPLYGYDWEITEVLSSGFKYTFLILPDAYYVIYEGTKRMARYRLPEKINMGSLMEYLRSYLILEEVIYPFINSTTTVVDSNNLFYLNVRTQEWATRQLIVNKETSLPVQSLSTIRNEELNLTQLEEVNFKFSTDSNNFPESTFDHEYYVSQGYTLKIVEDKVDTTSTIRRKTLSGEQRQILLHHPFLSASGDSVILVDIKARYILIDFWYASCLPCLNAIPELNRLDKYYSDMGFQVVGLNCIDSGNMKSVTSKLREKGINFPLFFSAKNLLGLLDINSFPSYFLITPDRNIEVINGGIKAVRERLIELFKK